MFSLKSMVSACVILHVAYGAAIPMWELLSKDEKMSYLYSMFANQVEEFCEFSEIPNCNRELLKYGLRKLKNLPEDHLDVMDPYQRGANSIIWDSMMNGHEMMKTTKKPKTSTTTSKPKPNSYDDPSFDQEFGLSGEASAKVESVSKFLPNTFVNQNDNNNNNKKIKEVKKPIRKISTGTPEYRYPTSVKDALPYEIINFQRPVYKNAPLDGPLVIKVYPDGTPVDDDSSKISIEDEDLKLYKLLKQRLPTFQ